MRFDPKTEIIITKAKLQELEGRKLIDTKTETIVLKKTLEELHEKLYKYRRLFEKSVKFAKEILEEKQSEEH